MTRLRISRVPPRAALGTADRLFAGLLAALFLGAPIAVAAAIANGALG